MRAWLALLLFVVGCSSPPIVSAPITCAIDETQCDQICAKLKTDDSHCGSCSNPCGVGLACANSACFPRDCGGANCNADQVCVDDACVDKSCVGVLCPAGQSCSGGECVCAPPFRNCGTQCVDPRTDDGNCGNCAFQCGASESCAAGACLPDDCGGDAGECDSLSVCLNGKCTAKTCVAMTCPSGQECRDGVCGCTGGTVQCGQSCVDPQKDDANCGSCAHACGAGDRCANGTCLPGSCGAVTCDADSVCKLGVCTEISCLDVICSGGKTCKAGQCTCTPPGQQECDGGCATVTMDVLNCGRCGNACPLGQTCSNGLCGLNSCSTGLTLCNGACVDTKSDALHCNACGAACSAGRNCVNSQCVCPAGLTFCNSACVNLTNDPGNCGMCGKGCGTGATCVNQVCTCTAGQSTCNGTCVTLNSDSQNCGQCNRMCTTQGTFCDGGNCACPPGKSLCNGACIDTSQDNLNCGTCGHVCPTNQYCTASSCQPPFTCQVNYTAPPAGCSAFPVDSVRCGQPGTATTSGPFTGTLPSTNSFATLPFTILSGERVRMTDVMTVSSASNVEQTLRSNVNGEISRQIQTVNPPGTTQVSITADGSPFTCAHPTDGRVLASFNGPVNYSVTFDRLPLSMRHNAGSTAFSNATPLQTVDGGIGAPACELVCGSVLKVCSDNSDDRQHFALTIPAQKAADFELYAIAPSTGGANMHLVALQPNGNTICNLVFNQLVPNTGQVWRARLVNNTDMAQPLVVFPWAWGSGTFRYHLAVGVEP